jgi:beta-glucosidase-like glycosyl hydrolase/CubicO group peptidase (beta-lactamase class C family)
MHYFTQKKAKMLSNFSKHLIFNPLICTFIGLGLLVIFMSACLQSSKKPYNPVQEAWVDSVFNTLDETEKIGQLFSIRAHSNLGKDHEEEVIKLIQTYKVGGLIFFQGTPHKQAQLTNQYQALSKVPLMISIDGEWGLGMRLDSTMNFPYQMTLGAVQEDSLIYEMGVIIGKQCKRIGLQVNFAPVIDINNNPRNPVINNRSFGENKERVALQGIAYMKGLQSQKIIASAKHFPGHGDTDQDSHFTLPSILKSKSQLEALEFYPFQQLIDNGLESVMVGHLNIPSLDNNSGRPSTLSKAIVTDLLQDKMGFEGLIFTDALEMKGVSSFYSAGEACILSLLAGNDVLLLPADVPSSFAQIKAAIKGGRLTWGMMDHKVKKVLRAKYFAGLNEYQPVKLDYLYEDLHSIEAKVLLEKLYQKSLTVIRNQEDLLPFKRIDTLEFASLALNTDKKNKFQEMLDNYADFEHFQIPSGAYPHSYNQTLEDLGKKNLVIVSLHKLSIQARKEYGLTWQVKDFIKKLSQKTKVVLVVFGSPYALADFENLPHLVCAYEDHQYTQRLVPQMLFGANAAEGKLPITASASLPYQTGITFEASGRLGFSLPESVGMSTDSLQKIDVMIQKAIDEKAMPGSQIVIARKGQIIWQKSYGFQTYDEKALVIKNDNLYDIASITKVASTLPAIMYLYNQGKLDLDQKISYYLPELKGSNKENIILREVLTHQAGLTPYIPFWKETMNETLKEPLVKYYQKQKSEKFSEEVGRGLYGWSGLEDMLWQKTMESPLKGKKSGKKGYPYAYSDLSFYILKRIAETLLEEPIEDFTKKKFYQKIGMTHTVFTPLQYFPLAQISPTEKDDYFRMQLIHGTVHDQGAAMLGGVGGHAGLFSTALDIAKYMQMHLQKGQYGGNVFFKPETTLLFTQPQFEGNRRGLGWDRKASESHSYIPDLSSDLSYGHSGFTGCVVWADPKEELVMVFLSNRVHPSAENNKLILEHVRRHILDQAYKAIVSPEL